MGLMDIVGGLLKKKSGGSAASSGGSGLPGGLQIPGLDSLGGAQGGLLKALLPMLLGAAGGKGAGGLGGLGDLLGKLNAGGLGGKAQSWVSTGPNEPVDPDELEQALGPDTVAKLAADAGVSPGEAKSGLATMLPGLVDKLTPGGSVPGADQLGNLVKGLDLGKLLGGR
jgi:uncharacterized protein YidB (DUF937 family)